MASVFIDQATNYDGAGSEVTSTGSTMFTLSGSKGGQSPRLELYVRNDAAGDFQLDFQTERFGSFRADYVAGAQWYAKLLNVDTTASVDLTYSQP